MASPSWCCTDKNGNAYVSLTDTTSAIKINYDTDIVSKIYVPPFENLELYDSESYSESEGFAGENTIIASSSNIDQ